MKIDYNIIRHLLIEIESMPPNKRYTSIEHLSEYDPEVVYEHFYTLLREKLVEGALERDAPGNVCNFHIDRLTLSVQDFLNASKNETIWKKVNDTIVKSGVSITFDILRELLKSELKKATGLFSSPESS